VRDEGLPLMGQKKSVRSSRMVPILIAGGIGYLLGGWQVTGLRSSNLSASESVALRFPDAWDGAQPTQVVRAAAPRTISTAAGASPANAGATAMGDVTDDAALLSPEPMVPAPAATQQASVPQASAPQDGADDNEAPLVSGVAPEPRPMSAVGPHGREIKLAQKAIKPTAALDRRPERPGFVLNDAQIASIKRRLNLTPDQERMWPAVEVALRNLSYRTAREDHARGAADTAQLAAADPNSAEVQNLKSAAIPLIMSFNDQQKDEVRSLAHVIGLDQLASQF
jgi:hypothetical protein